MINKKMNVMDCVEQEIFTLKANTLKANPDV